MFGHRPTPLTAATWAIPILITGLLAAPAAWADEAPVADAGPDQPDAVVGSLVTLDGTGSWDPDGDDIVDHDWIINKLPPGSTVTLDDPSSATPSFTPDVEGLYRIVLSVFDGCDWSTPDIVQVYAVRPGDLDGDGDIDWDDYDQFADCLAGPDGPATGDCGPAADMDGDGDVDLDDFAEFQRVFEG